MTGGEAAKAVATGKAPVKRIFKQGSHEFKALLKLFKTGEITSVDQPAAVRSECLSWFGKFTTNQFRSQFNKAKSIAGCASPVGPLVAAPVVPLEADPDDMSLEGLTSSQLSAAAGGALEASEDDPVKGASTESSGDWTPKMIAKEWKNLDGVRCFTDIVVLSSGASQGDSAGIEMEVTKDGNMLTIAESFPQSQLDVEGFYRAFPKDPSESDSEFIQRKFAMMEAIREMKIQQKTASIHKMKTPFHVDPNQKRVAFLDGEDECKCIHISVSEKKKLMKQMVAMMSHAKTRNNGNPSPSMKQHEHSMLG